MEEHKERRVRPRKVCSKCGEELSNTACNRHLNPAVCNEGTAGNAKEKFDLATGIQHCEILYDNPLNDSENTTSDDGESDQEPTSEILAPESSSDTDSSFQSC